MLKSSSPRWWRRSSRSGRLQLVPTRKVGLHAIGSAEAFDQFRRQLAMRGPAVLVLPVRIELTTSPLTKAITCIPTRYAVFALCSTASLNSPQGNRSRGTALPLMKEIEKQYYFRRFVPEIRCTPSAALSHKRSHNPFCGRKMSKRRTSLCILSLVLGAIADGNAASTLKIACSGNLINTRADGVTLGQCDLNFLSIKQMEEIQTICGMPGTVDTPVENQCRIRAVVSPDPISTPDHGKFYKVIEVWSVDKR
jgi:hypothetical protein